MSRAAVLLTLLGFLSSVPAVAAEEVPVSAPAAAAGSVSQPPPKAELKPPGADVQLARVEPPDAAPVEELNLGWTLVRTFVVLGFIIMVIYVTLNFGLRRLMGISAVPRGQAVVQVVERIPLDQKRAMFVVKAAGEYLLIGGGDGSLQLIAKLDAPEVEKLRLQRLPGIALSPFLQKLLKRREDPAAPAPGDPS